MMKKPFLLFVFILPGGWAYSQQTKRTIDYQYFRNENSYYAYELFKNTDAAQNNQLMINFSVNVNYKKVDKIYIKSKDIESKLKFKEREETVITDNPEQKFFPIVFNGDDLVAMKLPCETQIIFKPDNGLKYTLPLNYCNIIEFMKKN